MADAVAADAVRLDGTHAALELALATAASVAPFLGPEEVKVLAPGSAENFNVTPRGTRTRGPEDPRTRSRNLTRKAAHEMRYTWRHAFGRHVVCASARGDWDMLSVKLGGRFQITGGFSPFHAIEGT